MKLIYLPLFLFSNLLSATYNYRPKQSKSVDYSNACQARIKEGSFQATNFDLKGNDYQGSGSDEDYYETEKPEVPTQMFPRIVFILDKTGSMRPFSQTLIVQYNKLLNDMKNLAQEKSIPIKFSLVMFHQYLYIKNYEDILDAPDLNSSTYVARFQTALQDAVGCSLDGYKTENNNIVTIFSDGADNKSVVFDDKTEVAELLNQLQNFNQWNFNFVGINVNTDQLAGNLGILKKYSKISIQMNRKKQRTKSGARQQQRMNIVNFERPNESR